MKHGRYAYSNYKCRCDVCREANAKACRAWRARRGPADAREHGIDSTYKNYGCRCDPCTKAHSDSFYDWYHSRPKRQQNG